MKTRTKYLSRKLIKEALGIAYGLYRMNAKGAVAYGFSGTIETLYGEFLWNAETWDKFDGVIKFDSELIIDVRSKEEIPFCSFGGKKK